jgi:hypothetical protein
LPDLVGLGPPKRMSIVNFERQQGMSSNMNQHQDTLSKQVENSMVSCHHKAQKCFTSRTEVEVTVLVMNPSQCSAVVSRRLSPT